MDDGVVRFSQSFLKYKPEVWLGRTPDHQSMQAALAFSSNRLASITTLSGWKNI